MPWIISNGKSYVEIIGNNQMITTAYIDRAHTFNNKKTAEKYCSLLPKAMKNLKYKVIFISNPNPENPDLQLELLTPEFYLTRLKNFSDFIHTIQCQRETLVTGQRKAELEIEDIEHAAEFYNLDASHGYQLYKLLHDARLHLAAVALAGLCHSAAAFAPQKRFSGRAACGVKIIGGDAAGRKTGSQPVFAHQKHTVGQPPGRQHLPHARFQFCIAFHAVQHHKRVLLF